MGFFSEIEQERDIGNDMHKMFDVILRPYKTYVKGQVLKIKNSSSFFRHSMDNVPIFPLELLCHDGKNLVF